MYLVHTVFSSSTVQESLERVPWRNFLLRVSSKSPFKEFLQRIPLKRPCLPLRSSTSHPVPPPAGPCSARHRCCQEAPLLCSGCHWWLTWTLVRSATQVGTWLTWQSHVGWGEGGWLTWLALAAPSLTRKQRQEVAHWRTTCREEQRERGGEGKGRRVRQRGEVA